MVQRSAGHDHVERIGRGELLERDALEDRPLRRDGIDRGHVVAARSEGQRNLPVAAAHLQDA